MTGPVPNHRAGIALWRWVQAFSVYDGGKDADLVEVVPPLRRERWDPGSDGFGGVIGNCCSGLSLPCCWDGSSSAHRWAGRAGGGRSTVPGQAGWSANRAPMPVEGWTAVAKAAMPAVVNVASTKAVRGSQGGR